MLELTYFASHYVSYCLGVEENELSITADDDSDSDTVDARDIGTSPGKSADNELGVPSNVKKGRRSSAATNVNADASYSTGTPLPLEDSMETNSSIDSSSVNATVNTSLRSTRRTSKIDQQYLGMISARRELHVSLVNVDSCAY
jgi:hypothetical protein